MFRLISFLTSCAIVNPKNENNHCSLAVIATLHCNDGHWELQDVIGTKTMSQQRQLNSYSFILGNAENVSVFVERGIKDMVSNALVKLFGTIYKSGSECSMILEFPMTKAYLTMSLIPPSTNSLKSSEFVFPHNERRTVKLSLLRH